MPKKIRVYELARELGLTNKEALDLCVSLGIGVKSHSSSIEDAQADRVRRKADSEGLRRAVQPEEPAEQKPARATTPRAATGRRGHERPRSTPPAPGRAPCTRRRRRHDRRHRLRPRRPRWRPRPDRQRLVTERPASEVTVPPPPAAGVRPPRPHAPRASGAAAPRRRRPAPAPPAVAASAAAAARTRPRSAARDRARRRRPAAPVRPPMSSSGRPIPPPPGPPRAEFGSTHPSAARAARAGRPAPGGGPRRRRPAGDWRDRAPSGGPPGRGGPVVAVAASAVDPVAAAASAVDPVAGRPLPDCGADPVDAVVRPSAVRVGAVGTSRSSSRPS